MTPDPGAVEDAVAAVHGERAYCPMCGAETTGMSLPEGWTLIGPEQQAALADGLALRALQDTTGEQEGRWERSPGSQFSQYTVAAAAADAAREALP